MISPKFHLQSQFWTKYFWYYKRRKFWIGSLVILTFVSIFIYSVHLAESVTPAFGQFDYFLEADEYAKMGYLVNTDSCHILNISAWDKSILPFLKSRKPSDNCHQARQWTYVNHSNIVFNITALTESGYSLGSISCCYQPIKRVEQSPNHYDNAADNRISFSDECKPLQQVTRMEDEYVRVFCKSRYWPLFFDIVYRNLHAIALPFKNSKTTDKIKFWNSTGKFGDDNQRMKEQQFIKAIFNEIPETESADRRKPPNVFIFGIDSMSRLSFQRNMRKTRKHLQDIGAIEFLGYNKLGENTFPNAVAFLSGYHEESLEKICYPTHETRQDLCPYIWKRFEQANYLTAFVEDVTHIGTHNYIKTGFVQQPVDYYFRPFMLGVHRMSTHLFYKVGCIGRKTSDETVHKYMVDLLNMSGRANTPLFIYSWLSALTHDNMNAARYADDTYETFVKSLDLNNTILFFMSDHGFRFGALRKTFPGWYEDKLPNFWVYLPPTVSQSFPTWKESLLLNAKRLTSPMDLYRTMSHILDVYSDTRETPEEISQDGVLIKRRFGQSLFEEVPPTRNCQDAGIPKAFCACVQHQRLRVNDSNLILAAKAATNHINQLLPTQCTTLGLKSIRVGGLIKRRGSAVMYIIAFVTEPGNFHIESTVEYVSGGPSEKSPFKVKGELRRLNKIDTDVSCVIHDDFLEKFCYCNIPN